MPERQTREGDAIQRGQVSLGNKTKGLKYPRPVETQLSVELSDFVLTPGSRKFSHAGLWIKTCLFSE